MKTLLYFENEEQSSLYNTQVLWQIRQLYPKNLLVMISAGDFSSEGKLLRPSCKDRAGEYADNGADLILSLSTASVLGGYGKKEFAGAALMQRLRTVDRAIIPCTPVPGQTVKDCEKALRACAMRMFRADPDYRKELTGNLAANLPFREAQRRAVCACIPEAELLLSFPENRQALWLLDAMLQLYYMAEVEFIPAPECKYRDNRDLGNKDREERALESNGHDGMDKDSDSFEKAAAATVADLLLSSSTEQWIDIAGSTTQMVSDLFEKKEPIWAAGSLKEITQLLQPAAEDRSRLFLLKAILGVRKIYMQICSLHVYVPYCYVSAKSQKKEDLLEQLEASSWVPFIGDHAQEQHMKKDYSYLLKIDHKAEELIR